MIKGIGPVFGGRPASETTRVTGDTAVRRTDAVRAGDSAVTAEASPARRMAAEGSPVDTARVEAIRARIAAGTYAIDADAIAAAMVAQDLPAGPDSGPGSGRA